MLKHLFFTIAVLFIFNNSFCQTEQTHAAKILLDIEKLNTIGSVLYIAAHPDDENTRLLSYLANHKKLHTTYLSLTRGDGGQNLIGKEQSEALGLIRTQELLAARKVDGANQLFTRANDFGYSKGPDETLRLWNKDSILYDVVLAIRKLKPDVIICRFPTTGEGGHGHHTASALLAVEAFDLAANSNIYPEQLKYYTVWQAKRLYWNAFVPQDTKEINLSYLQLDVGKYNTLLGKSYGEIAAESRTNHKSQGFGSTLQRGTVTEYFKYYKGDSAQKDLFENIDWQWSRITASKNISLAIQSIIATYNPIYPHKSLDLLIALKKRIIELPETDATVIYYKQLKLAELNDIIVKCAGIWCEAKATDFLYTPLANAEIQLHAIVRNDVNVGLNAIHINNSDTILSKQLVTNEFFTTKYNVKITNDISNPYWLSVPAKNGLYEVGNRILIGEPINKPIQEVVFDFVIQNELIQVKRGLIYKSTDPVRGEVYRPVEILPPAEISYNTNQLLFNTKATQILSIIVKSNKANVQGKLVLPQLKHWSIKANTLDFSIAERGQEFTIELNITPLNLDNAEQLNLQLLIDGVNYSKTIKRISYDHIPEQFIASQAAINLIPLNNVIKQKKIAYITGAGDDVAKCLSQVGYDVTILNADNLKSENLLLYDAIIAGIRAYNTHEKLFLAHSQLMEYVKNGGNYIVQYNTNSRVGPMKDKVGPYGFTLSRDRVTNENAQVSFKNEKHPVLNYPNKIVSNDFSNWVQERSIYHATSIDANYETIFTMSDDNETTNDGSLIIAPYGKGNFVYTGISFFRQLPAGVTGAYRLLNNIIHLPKHDK